MITYKNLFEVYQNKIAWADRMKGAFPQTCGRVGAREVCGVPYV